MLWFDQLALVAMITVPLLGALFILFIPDYEFILRKKVSLFVVVTTAALHIRNSILLFQGQFLNIGFESLRPSFVQNDFQLRMDSIACAGLSFLLLIFFVFLFCLLSNAHENEIKLNSKALFALGLASACLLFGNFGLTLLLQFALIQALLVFNLRGTGPHRSSSALATSLFFTFIDLGAFFVWTWESDLALWADPDFLRVCLFLPSISRLAVPFFSPWARTLFANMSAEITILFVSTSFITGAAALARYATDIPFLANAAIVSAFFGALLSISDRSANQFLLRLASIASALALFLFTSQATTFKIQTFIFVCCISLLLAFGLLVGRVIQQNESQEPQAWLSGLWFCVLALLTIITLRHVPVVSLPWNLIFVITAYATSLRLRAPFSTNEKVVRVFFSRLPHTTITNAWITLAIVIFSLLGSEFFYLGMVLTS
jgi:hypothetical protein